MVSLQAEGSFWYHSTPHYPPSNEYISVEEPSSSSYPSIMITSSNEDPEVEVFLKHVLSNSFIRLYLSYPKRFSEKDHYTLFIPMVSDQMDQSEELLLNNGFSFRDREQRALGNTMKEELLLDAMCPFQIHPFQLKGRQTTIDTLLQPHSFLIDFYGNMRGKKITWYKEFPHATLFFY